MEKPNDILDLSVEDIEKMNSNVEELEEVDNMLLEIQEVEEQSDNAIDETSEAENKINRIEEQKVKIANFKNKISTTSIEFATLSVPYNDTSILETNSLELELVDYFFDSITCRR